MSKSEPDKFLRGEVLYGDDFTPEQIASWFREEEHAYFDLSKAIPRRRPKNSVQRQRCLFRYVAGRHFDTCLALGAAEGNDVHPLAPQVGQFIVVEPAKAFWHEQIGATPAHYRLPSLDGTIDLPNASVDIAVAISVLHHIANVSAVMMQLGRVLKPGGILLVEEPMTSMGDWRKQRPGLTKNERGIPEKLLLAMMDRAGLRVLHTSHTGFAPIMAMGRKFPWLAPRQRPAIVRLDRFLCAATRWNARYYRPSWWQKFAPTTLAVVATAAN